MSSILTLLTLVFGAPSKAEASERGKIPCSSIARAKEIPLKDEPDIHREQRVAEDASLSSCLVRAIADSTKMPDPRKTLKYDGYAVGDLAYGSFVRVNRLAFEQLLPPDIQERFPDEGVNAYFEYVSHPENRKKLAAQCRLFLNKSAG